MRSTTLRLLALPLIVLPLQSAGGVLSSHAAVTDVSCTGDAHSTYSPGVTDTERQTTITAQHNYTHCTSTDSKVTSGRSNHQTTRLDSCHTGASGTSGRETIMWNTGESSAYDFTRTVTENNGSATVHHQGTITQGKFAGDTATEDVALKDPDPNNCRTAQGETSASGTVQLQITK